MIICTKDNPWKPEMSEPGIQVQHQDAHEVGEQDGGWPGGDIVTMKCPNCGTRWRQELPQ